MGLGDLLGKVKDIAGNAGEINKLVDQLPSAVKSKPRTSSASVGPLYSVSAGESEAGMENSTRLRQPSDQ